jgi:hypothetical protein
MVFAFDFTRSLHHWINDALLTLFFFVIALELKREIVLGELRNVRTAALSFAGALGGMLVPACVYLVLMNGQPGMTGWGTVTATSTAFVVGCLTLLGSRIPPSLRLFLLSLAIFDDVGAIVVVAIGYGDLVNWAALALATLGLAALAGTARMGIRSIPAYEQSQETQAPSSRPLGELRGFCAPCPAGYSRLGGCQRRVRCLVAARHGGGRKTRLGVRPQGSETRGDQRRPRGLGLDRDQPEGLAPADRKEDRRGLAVVGGKLLLREHPQVLDPLAVQMRPDPLFEEATVLLLDRANRSESPLSCSNGKSSIRIPL